MALIRLRVCAVWSEHLLVAHIALLEISCRGSLFVLQRLACIGKFFVLVVNMYRHLYYDIGLTNIYLN